jgi:hypothetical protein
MGWASAAIECLRNGETVQLRPHGTSMRGKVEDGEQVTIRPIRPRETIPVGTVVLCKVKGREYLHIVKGIRKESYLIGNNKGGINGWTKREKLFGILVKGEC